MAETKFTRRDFLRLAGTAAAGVTVGTIAGACKPQTVTVEKEVKVPEIVEQTVVVEKVVEVPAEPPEPVTISYWQYLTSMEELEGARIAEFEEAYPNIKVDYVMMPGEAYDPKCITAFAAGTPPDVWNTAPCFYHEFIARDQLLDITDRIDELNLDDIYPAVLDQWYYKDRIYGLPLNVVVTILYYNKDLFDQASVEYPTEDWGWEDYRNAALKIQALNTGDRTEIWGCDWGSVRKSGGWLAWNAYVKGMGADIIDPVNVDRCVALESPIPLEFLKWHVDLVMKDKVAAPIGSFEGQPDPFMSGNIGMIFELPWGVQQYRDANFDWDIALVPKGVVERRTYGGPDGITGTTASKHPDESWQLMKWLTDPVYLKAWAKESGTVCPYRSVAWSEEILSAEPDRNMEVVPKSVEVAFATWGPGLQEYMGAFFDEMDAAFLGEKSPEETLESACNRVNEILETTFDELGL
jgi:multiple sugar transport system substrate-binding protein